MERVRYETRYPGFFAGQSTDLQGPPRMRHHNHVQFLDGLRGVAILWVLLYHCFQFVFQSSTEVGTLRGWQQTSPWLWPLFPVSIGWAGVPIFFVVSGFCIHLSHSRSANRSWGIFFTRRFFRIYPPYLLALLLFSFCFPPSRLSWSSANQWNLWSHIFLVHNFSEKTLYGINGAFWSIAVEVQLYLIYPLLVLLSGRLGWRRCLAVIFAVEMGCHVLPSLFFHLGLSASFPAILSRSPFNYWFSWSVGAKIADDWLENRSLFLGRTPIWPFALAFVICGVLPSVSRFGFLFAALCTGAVIARSLARFERETPTQSILSNRYLQWTGIISYSLYLLHEPLITVMPVLCGISVHGNAVAFWVCVLGSIPILAASWLFFIVVERPSIKAGKSFLVWRRSVRAVEGAA